MRHFVLLLAALLPMTALAADKFTLDENASGALVGYMLNANKLGTAEFTATYGRK